MEGQSIKHLCSSSVGQNRMCEASAKAGTEEGIHSGCRMPDDFPEFSVPKYTAADFDPNPEFCCKIEKEQRLDKILRMKANMTEYFDNRTGDNPYGQSHYDYKSVPPEIKLALEKLKMNERRNNYQYLAAHPELDAMLEIFIRKVTADVPEDSIKYAAEYFCQCHITSTDYQSEIEEEIKRIKRFRQSKHVEFHPAPSTNAEETIRKLNVGPFADIFKLLPTLDPPKGSTSEHPHDTSYKEHGLALRNDEGSQLGFACEIQCPDESLHIHGGL